MNIAKTSTQTAGCRGGISPISQSSLLIEKESSLRRDDQSKIDCTNLMIDGEKNMEPNFDQEIQLPNYAGNGRNDGGVSSSAGTSLINGDLITWRKLGWTASGLSAEILAGRTVLPKVPTTHEMLKPPQVVVRKPIDILQFDKTVFSAGASALQKHRLRVCRVDVDVH
jgi:hypothetical protein